MENGKNLGRCGKCMKFMSFSDILKKITCTSCRDWVAELPNTTIQLTNEKCTKDNYSLLQFKLMLGISESEETDLLDYKSKNHNNLIGKAQNFGVFVKICPLCTFNNKTKNIDYFGENELNRKCSLCKQKCFLACNKQKNKIFSVCSNYQCHNLEELLTDLKHFAKIDKKCEKCSKKLFTIKS